MSASVQGEEGMMVQRGEESTSLVSSPRKRKVLDPPSMSVAETGRPLVPATEEELKELRLRLATVVEETMRERLAGTERKGKGTGVVGAGATTTVGKQENTVTKSYLRAFQAAAVSKVTSMCDVQDSREQHDLVKEIVQFNEEMQTKREKLYATRTRVARMSADARKESLAVAAAADDRACTILEANAEHARKEKGAGGPLPPAHGAPRSGMDDFYAPSAAIADGFSGIEAGVLEPKVSLLIGKLSELPGPLKAVLQEIPELTASLAKTVQSVEAAMGAGESRTEALLRKAPPALLAKSKARGGDQNKLPPPAEETRATTREAQVEQARKEWEAGGVGMLGGMFS